MNKDKLKFIGDLAKAFSQNGWKSTGARDLARHLNENNVRTNAGKPYQPNSRGIFKLISSAWDHFSRTGDKQTADSIASAFNAKNGKPAWMNKKK